MALEGHVSGDNVQHLGGDFLGQRGKVIDFETGNDSAAPFEL